MTAITEQGQSLMDVAVQHCGDAAAILEIALLNDLSITDDIDAGTEIILPLPANKEVAYYFEVYGYIPATKENPAEIKLEGIGYWRINLDFKVS